MRNKITIEMTERQATALIAVLTQGIEYWIEGGGDMKTVHAAEEAEQCVTAALLLADFKKTAGAK